MIMSVKWGLRLAPDGDRSLACLAYLLRPLRFVNLALKPAVRRSPVDQVSVSDTFLSNFIIRRVFHELVVGHDRGGDVARSSGSAHLEKRDHDHLIFGYPYVLT